jgi:hypothetical protein
MLHEITSTNKVCKVQILNKCHKLGRKSPAFFFKSLHNIKGKWEMFSNFYNLNSQSTYRISANSFHRNYSFLKVENVEIFT